MLDHKHGDGCEPRLCVTCDTLRWGCEFYTRYRGTCKLCMRVRDKARGRERHWRKRGVVNFTQEDYNVMLEKQGGVCAICFETCPTGRALSADHNHETGEVRGLLCVPCNSLLGRVKDNAALLLRAAVYLKERG